MLFVSGWEVGVGEPWLTLHLALAGLGFGLVIAPILVRVIEGVPDEHRAAAASFVVVARMVGMTLGLAALAAWGVDHFQGLMSGFPFAIAESRKRCGGVRAADAGIRRSPDGGRFFGVPGLPARRRRGAAGCRHPGGVHGFCKDPTGGRPVHSGGLPRVDHVPRFLRGWIPACARMTMQGWETRMTGEGGRGNRWLLLLPPGFEVLLHVSYVLADVAFVYIEPVVQRHVAVLGMVGTVGPR